MKIIIKINISCRNGKKIGKWKIGLEKSFEKLKEILNVSYIMLLKNKYIIDSNNNNNNDLIKINNI